MAKKRKQVSDSQVDGDNANSESNDLSSEESENRRGRTVVAVVGKAIQKGIKISLEWNHNNVPTGVNRTTFANYIGVVVRERVSINFRDWDDVIEKVKDEVYEHITVSFYGSCCFEFVGCLYSSCLTFKIFIYFYLLKSVPIIS